MPLSSRPCACARRCGRWDSSAEDLIARHGLEYLREYDPTDPNHEHLVALADFRDAGEVEKKGQQYEAAKAFLGNPHRRVALHKIIYTLVEQVRDETSASGSTQ